MNLVREFDSVAPPVPEAGCRPLADAIEREHRRFVKRRSKERARGMVLMVFDEYEFLCVFTVQAFAHGARQKELLAQPEWHRFEERTESHRRVREIGFQQSLELQEGFVVKADVVQVARRQSGFAETIIDRVLWKTMIVFLARKSFLLRGCDDLSVDNQCCRGVVIKRRNAKDCCHVVIGGRVLHSE